MQSFSAGVIAGIQSLIAQRLGDSGQHTIIGPMTTADLSTIALILAITAVVQAVTAYSLARHSRIARRNQVTSERRHLAQAVGKPLYIVIWLCGLHFAAEPIFSRFQFSDAIMQLRGYVDYLMQCAVVVAGVWLLVRSTHPLEACAAVWANATKSRMDDLLVPLVGTALRVSIVAVAGILWLPTLGLPPAYSNFLSKLAGIVLVLAVASLLKKSVDVLIQAVLLRFDLAAADNLEARKASTRFHLIGRVLYVVIGLFAVASILMMFQEVRHIGTSLLASAGVAGIVVGFAAQKTLANLFAGFQLAFSQPVRQDDVVVVEGEWGRVEEITLTFIIVRIWDDRRLVLPLSYFIEKPFQNWTRTSAEIMGSVMFWVDYSFPVAEGRIALKAIVESSALWDKRFWNLQVSDTSEKSVQLRVLATSVNSSINWDLRCEIREKFLAYIQDRFPQCLPSLRIEMPGTKTDMVESTATA